MSNSVLIVEDDELVAESLLEVLRNSSYSVTVARNGEDAALKIREKKYDLALIDLRLPVMSGLDCLKIMRQEAPSTECVMMTSFATAETAVQAMKMGAADYISKPIDDDELKQLLSQIFKTKPSLSASPQHSKNQEAGHFHNLVGEDTKMQKIYSVIKAINDTNITVLLKGESGTGKGMIAQAIHYSDPARKNGPYIEVSCGAIPRELLESELFGHVKGAFTSAVRDRIGRFELADGGTILLDEIDSLPPYLQVKLLRVIQQKVFEMVGDTKTKRVDVRIIAATNRNLEDEIKAGNFREDLYYRLKVITIEIPPLRERKADIIALTRHFLHVFNEKQKRNIKGITKDAMDALIRYDWPGNVRELENTLERIVVLSEGEIITLEHLPEYLHNVNSLPHSSDDALGGKTPLKGILKEPEKKIILQALEQAGWNRKKAASILNISRTTLYNKIKEHQLVLK